MEKVLDIYERPYDPAYPVVCMDETPRQLIGEVKEPIPMKESQPAHYDYEYRRCGTCNVFMANEPLAGKRITKVTEHRTKIDWAHFLADIAEHYQEATKITLVMDNLNTHRIGSLTKRSRLQRPMPWRIDLSLFTHRSMAVGSTWPK